MSGVRGTGMEIASWAEALGQEFSNLASQAAAYLPRLLLAAVLLLGGWLIAKLLRMASVRFLLGLDRLWHQFITRRGLERLQPQYPPARIAGEIVFWFVILFTVAGAASALGLGAFVEWLSQVAAYLPILLTGMLIILAGVIISALMRDVITSAAQKAGVEKGDLLGRITQATILLITIAVGIDQIGVDISFISVVVGVALAATFGGVALAFGIGAHDYMGNIIAAHQLRHQYRAGDHLRIRDIEGTVAEITTTKVVLNTERGSVVVPAKLFEQEISVLAEQAERDA